MRAPYDPIDPLSMRMAGVLFLRFDNLPAVVRPAAWTDKVRPLRLVTLGTLDGRDRVQLPVGGTPASRLRARGFPFGIGHGYSGLDCGQVHVPSRFFPQAGQSPSHSSLHSSTIGSA